MLYMNQSHIRRNFIYPQDSFGNPIGICKNKLFLLETFL
uniref:Ribosomal protein L32 n=1 Tax=Garcinia pedunculata TaxID=1220708 RepID=A0A6M8AXF5_9ROSI|nr:ribosomal protein L32 [Garcinia pedunculata]QKD75901.1 ribosomal protein L32 [Garcinia pedunculata]